MFTDYERLLDLLLEGVVFVLAPQGDRVPDVRVPAVRVGFQVFAEDLQTLGDGLVLGTGSFVLSLWGLEKNSVVQMPTWKTESRKSVSDEVSLNMDFHLDFHFGSDHKLIFSDKSHKSCISVAKPGVQCSHDPKESSRSDRRWKCLSRLERHHVYLR